MSKKYWLIVIILIILMAGVLYRYFNYQFSKTASMPSVRETTENENIENKVIKSIPLEKPPFVK